MEENKVTIGRLGAIPPLVSLLESGGFRAKKEASTALYFLCSVKENKIRAVQVGIMKPLVELMADFTSRGEVPPTMATEEESGAKSLERQRGIWTMAVTRECSFQKMPFPTPMWIFKKMPFPPPSPTKHIHVVLRRRKEKKKVKADNGGGEDN
ncbi:unnamed protein product [Linum tenue]|uniref:Uncharacterized protein n=1 Tax=Linum tenue TaxID=586396 RepID=A0AAV0KXV3_9ROSI|nr:unnamed protein product [Linum tenue]